MIESHYPTATQLASDQRARLTLIGAGFVISLALVFGLMAATTFLWPNMSGATAALLGGVLFLCLALPVAIFNNPRIGVYVLMLGGVLCGGSPGAEKPTIPTTYIPFWYNISIIGQTHGTTALNGISISPAELLIILTLTAWLIRGIAKRDLKIHGGPLMPWMLAYIGMVSVGFIEGLMRGGDLIAALWEIRTQFLFLACFIAGANLIDDREQVKRMLFVCAFCIGIQGIFGAITYFSLGGEPSEEGIMAHDDSMLFNFLYFVLFIGGMMKLDKRLSAICWVMLPWAIIATLANQRRAGIAAFGVAFLPLIPMVWVICREHRKQVAKFAVVFGIISAIYLPIAWNGQGAWALPARALRSSSNPTERDAASNLYRMTEDYNLKFTRDLNPWFGKGYGRPFAKPAPLPEIAFPMKDFFPHNSLLWVWMNVGNVGFFCFLMMYASIGIHGMNNLKSVGDPWLRMMGILAILDMLMLFIFGKYDLAIVNGRQMVFAAILVGVLSNLKNIKTPVPPPVEEAVAQA